MIFLNLVAYLSWVRPPGNPMLSSVEWRRTQTSFRFHRSSWLAIVFIGLALAVSPSAKAATFHGLGFDMRPESVSADNSIVVGEGFDELGSYAIRWTSGVGVTDLWDDGWASGISANGSVIVGEGWDEFGNFAVRWTSGSGATLLWDDGWASGISANGSVIVGEQWDEFGSFAVRWTSGSGTTLLWEDGWATDISADGTVIVGEAWDEIGDFAVRWTSETDALLLWEDGGATSVSADGAVVVGDRWDGTLGHAVRWTSGSGAIDLWADGMALGVSADGSAVVGRRWDGTDSQAVLWTSASGSADLRALLIDQYDLSAELTGWSLLEATAISGDASTIFGEGINPAGYHEAWRVVLPTMPPGLPGDFDGDGIVDGHDFLAWQRNPALGNLADWEAGFGQSSAQVAQIPEPSTALLFVAAIVFAGRHRREG